MLFSEAARRAFNHAHRAGLLAPTTLRNYRSTISICARIMDNPELRQLRRRDIEACVHQPDLTVTSRRARISAVRWVINWAIDQGHIAKDPTRGIKLPRPPRRAPRRLGITDTAQVVAGVADDRLRLILSLMLHEGLRCGEVARLTHEEIDLVDRMMLVHGKGGHERVLPITAATLAELLARTSRTGPVIRSRNDPRAGLLPVTVGSLVSRHMADVGIHVAGDGKTAHALRHTAASTVLERCGDLRTVARMLGHQSVVTTERYTSGVDVDLRAAMGD